MYYVKYLVILCNVIPIYFLTFFLFNGTLSTSIFNSPFSAFFPSILQLLCRFYCGVCMCMYVRLCTFTVAHSLAHTPYK